MTRSIHAILIKVLVLWLLCVSSDSSAQVITPLWSGVESRFASQSDMFRDSDPPMLTWGPPPGLGPYPPNAEIPGLPPAWPPLGPYPGNPFAGGGHFSTLTDAVLPTPPGFQTISTMSIDDSSGGGTTSLCGVQIIFPAWRLLQQPAALGYTYNQLNFGSDYLVTSNPVGLSGGSCNTTALLFGSAFGPASYVQFDAVIHYHWTPVTLPGPIFGTPSPLGSVSFNFSAPPPPLPGLINTTITSSGTLLGTPPGDGVLSLTGHAWIAGDPFDLLVTLVPEPSGAALLLLAEDWG